jgi:hypothetical protein
MAKIGKTKKAQEVHIIPRSLELDVYYGLASDVEDAKERAIKFYKKEYGKDTQVFFDGVA